jgi:hypothetical protein
MFIVDDEVNDIEEQAANVEETETVETEQSTEETKQPTSPVEPVDQTKAFATRLKEEKAKAKQEAKEEIAKSFGYNSWSEYANAQTNNKLLDNGLDPDAVRPLLQDIIKGDPEYQEAMKYKAEKEALEKELFATNSIKALNDTFGTAYSSVDELDPETIRLWNAGTPLANAYAAVNWESIRDAAVKKASVPKETGKSHLKQVPGGGGQQTSAREFTKEELNAFAKMYGYTEAQVKEYMNRTNNK